MWGRIMIEKKQKYVDPILATTYVQKYSPKPLNEMRGDEVVEMLFDNNFKGLRGVAKCRPDFLIVNVHWQPSAMWWQRLNRFWIAPLTLICAPYQYIAHGEIGWDDKSKIGRTLLKLSGCL